MKFRSSYLLIFVFFLSSCVHVQLKPEEYNQINNIGIVSVLGDEILIYDYKSMRVSGKDSIVPFDPGWNMDKKIYNITKNLFEKYGKKTIVDINYEYKKIQKIYQSSPFTSEISLNGYEKYFSEIVKDKNIDTLLIISPCNCGDRMGGNTNNLLSGYGLYRKKWGEGQYQYNTFAALRVTLVRVKGFDIIASTKNVENFEHINDRYWFNNIFTVKNKSMNEIERALTLVINNTLSWPLYSWYLIDTYDRKELKRPNIF